jgi:hypothetical protein
VGEVGVQGGMPGGLVGVPGVGVVVEPGYVV